MKSGHWVSIISIAAGLVLTLVGWMLLPDAVEAAADGASLLLDPIITKDAPMVPSWFVTAGVLFLSVGLWIGTMLIFIGKRRGVGPGFFIGFVPTLLFSTFAVTPLSLVLSLLTFPLALYLSSDSTKHFGPTFRKYAAYLSLRRLFRGTSVDDYTGTKKADTHRRPSTAWFDTLIWLPAALFTCGMIAILASDLTYTDVGSIEDVINSARMRQALWLSVWTTLTTTVIGLAISIPMGYSLSRYRFVGHSLIDALVDLPILLPPLIVGLSLLVFFQTPTGRWIESIGLSMIYQKRGIVLCQLFVSISFGIRAMKLTFDGIDIRLEHVAMTLGRSRVGAFFSVALPMARRGVVTAGILIWTRALGIFGPLMLFVGAVEGRTEVLPTTIFLEQSVGRIEMALAVAVLMVIVSAVALVTIRIVGLTER